MDMGDSIGVVEVLRRLEPAYAESRRRRLIQQIPPDVPPESRAHEIMSIAAAGYHTGVEIGVHRGDTSAALLRAFPGLTLVMVDPWAIYPANHPYRQSGDGCARLTEDEQELNRSWALAATAFASTRRLVLRLESEKAAARLPHRQLSFVFIDGDHTFEAVATDIRLWWPRVEAGGILLGHDLGHPRDNRGVWGVRRAVEEFVEREQVEVATEGSLWWAVKGEA